MTQIQAKKHLGQNFLRNKKILEKIVWDELLENISVIEVWPGPGDLTAEILQKHPLSLTVIEIDPDMIPLIRERFHGKDITIYKNDVLKVNISWALHPETKKWISVIEHETTIKSPAYYLYGNIPYYITSPILHHFLYEVEMPPLVAVFTMQKEVADRILARGGDHSVLSLACQLMADVEKICDISPNNFTPVPKVWSTCLKFTTKWMDSESAQGILKVIKKWFSQKRKKLISNLIQWGYSKENISSIFESLVLSDNVRAEELSLEVWKFLYKNLKENSKKTSKKNNESALHYLKKHTEWV